MNRERYERAVTFFKTNKKAHLALSIIYKVLPYFMLVSYPVLLLYAFHYDRGNLLELCTFPFAMLFFTTILRRVVNETRPYEKYGIESVFGKKTQGKSMPSRHTASAFIIAMAFLYVNVPLGIAAMVIALLIEASRIMAGAHYVHDVVAGTAISVLAGWVFFFIV